MTYFNSAWLLRKKKSRLLTGVTAAEFHKMVDRLRPAWERYVVASKNRDGRPYGVGGLEDHLLVLLIVYRCHITQDFDPKNLLRLDSLSENHATFATGLLLAMPLCMLQKLATHLIRLRVHGPRK